MRVLEVYTPEILQVPLSTPVTPHGRKLLQLAIVGPMFSGKKWGRNRRHGAHQMVEAYFIPGTPEYPAHTESVLVLRVLAPPTDEVLPALCSISAVHNPQIFCSMYRMYPQHQTPNICEECGSIRSADPQNTASSRSIPQYVNPKYCECTKSTCGVFSETYFTLLRGTGSVRVSTAVKHRFFLLTESYARTVRYYVDPRFLRIVPCGAVRRGADFGP